MCFACLTKVRIYWSPYSAAVPDNILKIEDEATGCHVPRRRPLACVRSLSAVLLFSYCLIYIHDIRSYCQHPHYVYSVSSACLF
jgi:hypothetical protein